MVLALVTETLWKLVGSIIITLIQEIPSVLFYHVFVCFIICMFIKISIPFVGERIILSYIA